MATPSGYSVPTMSSLVDVSGSADVGTGDDGAGRRAVLPWVAILMVLLAGLTLSRAKGPEDWLRDLDHADEFVRLMALTALREAPAEDVGFFVPKLLWSSRRDRSEDVRILAREVIVALGADAVEPLMAEAFHPAPPDQWLQAVAVQALSSVGSPAATSLVSKLRSFSGERVSLVIRSLSGMGEAALAPVAPLADDADATVRRRALGVLRGALARTGRPSRHFVELVLRKTTDVDVGVRRQAYLALGSVVKHLTDEDVVVLFKQHASTRGRVREALRPVLAESLTRRLASEASGRRSAERAITALGAPLRPYLERLRRSPDDGLRALARKAIRLISP